MHAILQVIDISLTSKHAHQDKFIFHYFSFRNRVIFDGMAV